MDPEEVASYKQTSFEIGLETGLVDTGECLPKNTRYGVLDWNTSIFCYFDGTIGLILV